MIRLIAAAALAAMSTSAVAQRVEVAAGNWAGIPAIAPAKAMPMSDRSMGRIEKLLEAGKCPRYGDGSPIRLEVPFLLQFDTGGAVQRIVVRRIECPELESVIGGVIASRAKSGYYQPTGANGSGWYRSDFSYSLD
jgi:hypothetical protein